MAATIQVFIVFCLALPVFITGTACPDPVVKEHVYTTSESSVSAETIFIVEFTLTCKHKLANINLYADINGKTIPASRIYDGKSYQISISDEHKNLPAGQYPVKLYDEEGYSALRKAQRSGEAGKDIKPLAVVNISHRGVWQGPLVQTEIVATLVATLVWYLAYVAKGRLQK